MTVPAGQWDTTPDIHEALLTTAELEVWARRPAGSLTGDSFAIAVINAASLLVREAGDLTWSLTTVPQRARLIAIVVAKNYFINPDGLKSETTGPLSETRIDDVVHNMSLTEAQKTELAGLAGEPVPGEGGLWVQPTGQGRLTRDTTVFVTDQSGTDWMLPFVAVGDHLYPPLD